MIHWHKHHIVPKHAGGTDDPSNLLKCNIAMHAFMHEQRYRDFGNDLDRIAACALKKQITKAEARRQAHINWIKQNPKEVHIRAKKAGAASAEWTKNNPKQAEINAKKGGKAAAKWNKDNPELAHARNKKGAALAAKLLAKPVTTPKGTFATTREAAKAHGITMSAAGARIHRGTRGWVRPTGE